MVDAKPDILAIFSEALAQDTDQDRSQYLDQACGDESELRRRLDELLRAHHDAGRFLVGEASVNNESLIAEQPGTIIGPYKLLQQIGEGGMGVVFMAEQSAPIQRIVALKIIKPGMDTRQVIARFEAERQALAMMDHPNIARVIDAGTTEGGRSYFVMDLVKGVPITEYCDQHQMTVRQRLELFKPVCEAIQHAHQKGIIHRDLKPTNVLVAEYDGRPVPKIIDFGVAKATAQKLIERTMFTEFGQVIGTVDYMSPEQAMFNQLDVDTRSDIYSMGVLLYELLTGSTPFERKRLRDAAFDEMLRIIREEEPPKPSTRLSTSHTLPSISTQRQVDSAKLKKLVNGELDWIIMKCLEKDRDRRDETASALAADLQHYLNDESVQARPATRLYQLKKFMRRNKAGVLAATAILTALIVGIILASVGLIQARHQARIAKTEADKAIAIKTLLQNALKSADPDTSKGSDYTVREMLSDISSSLGERLAAQPEVEIELRTTIASTYLSIGNSAAAEAHLKRALELARRTFGPDDEQLAPVLACYSHYLFDRGDRAGSENAIRDTLRIHRLHNESGSPFLDAASWHCYVLLRLGKTAEAESVGRESLASADASGREYPETASIFFNLAHVKKFQKDFAAAERMLERAVEITRRWDGPESRGTANVLQYLGIVLAAEKEYAEAEASFREALKIDRRNCDPNHWAVRQAMDGLTEVLRAQGKEKALTELETEQKEWAATKLNHSKIAESALPNNQQPKPNAKPSTLNSQP